MSDEDIKREVRDLLSSWGKRHSKTEVRWTNMGLVCGVIVGAIVTGAVNKYIELGGIGSTVSFLVVSIFVFASLFGIGETENAKRAEKLAEKFYKKFPKDTAEFTKAIALIRNAKTETGFEKALLSALKMDVIFGAPVGPSGAFNKSITIGGGKGASTIHNQFDQMFDELAKNGQNKTASGAGWSNVTTTSTSWSYQKIPEIMFKKLVENGKIEPLGEPGKRKGVGVMPSGAVVYYGNIDTKALQKTGIGKITKSAALSPQAGDKSEQLLGGFDAGGPKHKKSAGNNSDEPAGNAGFIPLDPYDDKEAI